MYNKAFIKEILTKTSSLQPKNIADEGIVTKFNICRLLSLNPA